MKRFFLLLMVALCLPLWGGVGQAEPTIRYLPLGEAKPLYSGTLPEDVVLDTLEVHLIHVDAADAILLRSGEMTMLVDSGRPITADRVLAYLASIGVEHLNYALGTHPHDDHLGGFPQIIREIPTDVYLTPALFEADTNQYTRSLQAELERQQIPVRTLHDGDRMTFGTAEIRFYQTQKRTSSINNRSMAAKVTCGERSILLAADIEAYAQSVLIKKYGQELSADILKVPHHGLAWFMTAFYETVQPELCTLSCTPKRIEKTIKALDWRNIDWLLTTEGTIVAVTDGSEWVVWQEG